MPIASPIATALLLIDTPPRFDLRCGMAALSVRGRLRGPGKRSQLVLCRCRGDYRMWLADICQAH